ncbi:hypothetical protein [Enterococcus sp. CWB-B31]|uniref:hypothetical protein n=1 Tax=Enterococcus sp. CWB-B31 TaxID=2885159 RepID=UPI001E5ADA89|nr:hypothetical protein [Enterococcus sp. CWB-B31]MCB5953467.1 hypothetical protein [Enterococcus sp. CWB-B31]
MKKKILLVAGLTILLAGCSELPQQERKKQAEAEEFGLFVDKLAVLLKERKLEEKEKATEETSSSSQETTAASTDVSAEAVQEAADKSQYPYMVSLTDLATVGRFSTNGMNTPNNIDLSFITESNGVVTMSFNQPSSNIIMYTASYRQIPTKSIRVFSAGTNEIRTVSVNSEIILEYLASAYGGLDQGNLYVFTNSGGGLSLATPNYAGNAASGQEDVMLEYLP